MTTDGAFEEVIQAGGKETTRHSALGEEEQNLQREAGERGSGAGGGALEAINESEPQTSCWLTPGKDQTFLLQYGGTDVHPPPPGVLKGT